MLAMLRMFASACLMSAKNMSRVCKQAPQVTRSLNALLGMLRCQPEKIVIKHAAPAIGQQLCLLGMAFLLSSVLVVQRNFADAQSRAQWPAGEGSPSVPPLSECLIATFLRVFKTVHTACATIATF